MISLSTFTMWWIQIALFVTVAALLPRALRFRNPRGLLVYWQLVSVLALVLAPLSRWAAPSRLATPFILRAEVTALTRTANKAAPHSWWMYLLCAGTVILLVRFVAGLLVLRRYRDAAVRFELSPHQQAVVHQLCGRAEVLLHARAGGPVSYGWLRPVILLPASCGELEAPLLDAVLVHELLHLRRRDWLLHLAEELYRAALWIHPAVWYCVARTRLFREQAVDQESGTFIQRQGSYVEALLRVADLTHAGAGWLPAPLFSRKHQLVSRIQMITEQWNEENKMTIRKARTTLAMLVALLVVTGCAASFAAPLSDGKAYGAADGIEVPKIIHRKTPLYPASAKDARVQGVVKLALKVSPEGQPYDIQVARSVDAALDQAAIDAVQEWRWAPGLKDGKPVIVATEVEITFTLAP